MFTIDKKLQGALGRAGTLQTAHGVIETPAFVAVGTKATVKSLTPEQIRDTGAQIVLGNTYHLYLEPGEQIVAKAGGLGTFMGWDGPTMTDSGGFQVFSLGAAFGKGTSKLRVESVASDATSDELPLAKVDDEGVTFKSYKDGSSHRFTPERSIDIQHALSADIIFAFDECTSPAARKEYQREAMERTHRWAARCIAAHTQPTTDDTQQTQMLFGIVQGGRHEDLRKESARTIGTMEFDGFGIGGSFEKEDMGTAVRWVNEILPEEKPRHLLGIGEPADLFDAVENGCDTFDCVAPTRQARNGSLYTAHGRINITNAMYKGDFGPIDAGCECYTCTHFSRAYIAHLFRSDEILANTLATIHNVQFIVRLTMNMRNTILSGTFSQFKADFLTGYKKPGIA